MATRKFEVEKTEVASATRLYENSFIDQQFVSTSSVIVRK